MNGELPLTLRLSKMVDLIPPCRCLCDVGTDHAYLPIAALRSNKAEFAYATDVNEGPLQRATMNGRLYGVADKMEPRLGDGLAPIDGISVDVITIAGMGGQLIIDILARGEATVNRCKCLILQPMREVEAVRTYLVDKAIRFTETIIKEDRRYYHIICAHPAERHNAAYNDLELFYGFPWLENCELFFEEATRLVSDLMRIESGITTDNPQSLERKLDCRRKREYLQGVLENAG